MANTPLSKIYIGAEVVLDGNSIATAIGSEASSSTTFDDLTTAITANKSDLATNLTAKGVTASSSETLSSLVDKVNDITSGGTPVDLNIDDLVKTFLLTT